MLFGALTIPFMREVLSYKPLPGSIITIIIAFSFIGLTIVEIAKWFFFGQKPDDA